MLDSVTAIMSSPPPYGGLRTGDSPTLPGLEAPAPPAPKVRVLPMRPDHDALIMSGEKTSTLRRTAFPAGLYRTHRTGLLVHLSRDEFAPPIIWTSLSDHEKDSLALAEGYLGRERLIFGAAGIAGIGDFFAGTVAYYRHEIRPATAEEARSVAGRQ